MKVTKLLEPEFHSIKEYLECHNRAETAREFNRCTLTIKKVDMAKNYAEFDKYRSDRSHWCQSINGLPEPENYKKMTPIERFNQEWYFNERYK